MFLYINQPLSDDIFPAPAGRAQIVTTQNPRRGFSSCRVSFPSHTEYAMATSPKDMHFISISLTPLDENKKPSEEPTFITLPYTYPMADTAKNDFVELFSNFVKAKEEVFTIIAKQTDDEIIDIATRHTK